jgi:cobalt/nickel transport system permease protein
MFASDVVLEPLARLSAKVTVATPVLQPTGPRPMHIPDGFLSTPVAIVLWLVAILGVGYALRRVSRDLDERKVPMMGVMAAAIFAGQMLNFSVTGGTSGHLLGATLAAIVLGPWAAVLVMTCVVSTQALLFQDGGLLALGANITNMALVGVAVGYAIYQTAHKLTGETRGGILLSGFVSSWFSVVIAAMFCALQLAASGTSPANVAVPAMAGIHVLIGIGEGLITAGALALLYAARRDLLAAKPGQVVGGRALWIGGLVVAVVLAILSPLASAHPDGLEWVAEQQGFGEAARNAPYRIIPDYVFPGISNEKVATIAAGVAGLTIVFVVMWLVGMARRKRETTQTP